jgi:CAAX protease family protein
LFLDAAATAVTLLIPLPMVITANAAIGRAWAHHAIAILAGFTAGATFLFGVFDLSAPGTGDRNPIGVDVGIMVTAVAAATLASMPVREWLARFIPIDPDNPVHSYALVLAVILLGTQLAPLAFSNVLAQVSKLPPLTIGDLVGQEAPLVIIGLAGVGLYIRRSAPLAADRLGLVTPAWWHITLALGLAGVFWGVNIGAEWLSHALTPGLADSVDRSSLHLFGGLLNAPGIVALTVLPAICEETLFRGALQPRLGLVVTAVLFASIHTDYGLTIDLAAIFVLALGLGLIRRYLNTTASMTCHGAYNLLVGLGLTGTLLIAAEVGIVVLLGVSAYEVWRRRRVSGVDVEKEAVR